MLSTHTKLFIVQRFYYIPHNLFILFIFILIKLFVGRNYFNAVSLQVSKHVKLFTVQRFSHIRNYLLIPF